MKKIIAIFLIIIGFIFLMTPFLIEQIIKYNSKSLSIEEMTGEEMETNNKAKVYYNSSSINDVDITSIIKNNAKIDKKFVVGIITIPDLNIKLPILKGLTEANLLAGAATMKSDQAMGVGNYTLAGHYMKKKALLFGNLMDIKIGTIVTITDKKMVYTYKIYDTVVVSDTSVDLLLDKEADKRGNPIISLMTCYYSSKTGKRFFALGDLIDESPYK